MKYLKAVLLLLFCVFLFSCTDDGVKYYNVYRQNYDGTYTVWRTINEPITKGAFVYFKDEKGKMLTISGIITIETKVLEQKSKKGAKNE